MTLLNLNKRNSEVSVLVQVSAEDKDLTFPVHKLLAKKTQMAVSQPVSI
jgi:hypothetical protein